MSSAAEGLRVEAAETEPRSEWYRLDVTSRYASFGGVVRIERPTDSLTQASAAAFSEAGRVGGDIRTGTVTLSDAEWSEFAGLIAAARFWELPELIPEAGKWFDGPTVELIGCRGGRSHRVWRRQPDEQQDGESLVWPVRWLEAVLGRAVGGWVGLV